MGTFGTVVNLGPTYTQEAVADLTHVIDEFELEGTKIFWANEWHREMINIGGQI